MEDPQHALPPQHPPPPCPAPSASQSAPAAPGHSPSPPRMYARGSGRTAVCTDPHRRRIPHQQSPPPSRGALVTLPHPLAPPPHLLQAESRLLPLSRRALPHAAGANHISRRQSPCPRSAPAPRSARNARPHFPTPSSSPCSRGGGGAPLAQRHPPSSITRMNALPRAAVELPRPLLGARSPVPTCPVRARVSPAAAWDRRGTGTGITLGPSTESRRGG